MLPVFMQFLSGLIAVLNSRKDAHSLGLLASKLIEYEKY